MFYFANIDQNCFLKVSGFHNCIVSSHIEHNLTALDVSGFSNKLIFCTIWDNGLESTQPLTEINTSDICWWVKATGA